MSDSIEVKIPIKIISENNSTEHWTKKAKRHKLQKYLVKSALKSHDLSNIIPCTVYLTRHSPRTLDSDNLQGALKWIRDQVADCLIPGQRPGMADSDPRITWIYSQEKEKIPHLRIKLEKQ